MIMFFTEKKFEDMVLLVYILGAAMAKGDNELFFKSFFMLETKFPKCLKILEKEFEKEWRSTKLNSNNPSQKK
jgi:hypothetical protein